MKIFYDHQIFTFQKYGGISRYFFELMKYFKSIGGVNITTPFIFSNNYYISDNKIIKHMKFLPHTEFRGKYRLFRLLISFNKILAITNLKKQDFDIFHPTYYDPYFLKYIGNKPFVLTVHDMIHEKFGEMFKRQDKTSEHKRLLVKKATIIIAVSENTKKDLIDLFGINESKIEVVYHGNSMLPGSDLKINIDIPKNYILFVGLREDGYKNFNRFIKAVSSLLIKNKELFVVCAGGGKFRIDERALLEQLDISKQVVQYDVNDNILAYLYKNASVFVFPSLYEGFGIPVLEAFASNCPLVCSNTSSLPEIAGEGAIYFDPYSEDSIKNAIIKVLENTNLRNNIVRAGIERLKNFSWEKTAIKTKRIYEKIM
ncbi:MAG TPA: glycosyltransferase family 1 protein [Deltaproteobacteria bacterium]|nr:glycosyltransferase family 1 protein [Deltaproteobacteria bacterium]